MKKSNDRGPDDYPDDMELQIPIKRLLRRGQVATSGSAESLGKQIAQNILQGLMVAGVSALVAVTWKLGDTVARLETFLTERTKIYDRDIQRIDGTLERHDQRIERLEHQRRNP